ncbi:hypothetical protein MKW94_020815 [Papaver nudicaule]|uniref:Uncharacterized protein n=1 Tax=Papaver nudicaule TaxID=74823 RepID=A0AA41S9N2_PAPNU|nr:hypothetical protein [Papaver nudicaule]
MDTIMNECEKRKKDKEIELWKRKYFELQRQFVVQKQDAFELREELRDHKTKYDALYMEVQEKKMAVEEYKRRFKELGVQADSRLKYELELESKLEDCETKYTAEIGRLVNELNEYKSRCDQLDKQIKSLEEKKEASKATTDEGEEQCHQIYGVTAYFEREQRKAEEETEVLRTEFRELKSRTASWEKELDEYKVKCHGLLVELKEKEMQCIEYESKFKNLTLVGDGAFRNEFDDHDMSNHGLKEEIMGLAKARKIMPEGEKRAEEKTACLGDVLKKQVLGLEQNSTCDRRGKEISPKLHNGGKDRLNRITASTTLRFSGEEGEKCGISRGADDMPSSSAPKRWRVSEISTSNSENKEDDTTPNGKRRVKQLGKLSVVAKPKMSVVNPSAEGRIVEKFVIATSRKRLVSPRTCELGKKSQTDDTSKDGSTFPDNLDVNGLSEEKIGNQTVGRFMARGSESCGSGVSLSHSQDAVDNEFDFGQDIATRKSSRYRESKWQNEADMVLSFKEDPTLCMKAVCALHRHHTEMQGSLRHNNKPLSKFAALRFVYTSSPYSFTWFRIK